MRRGWLPLLASALAHLHAVPRPQAIGGHERVLGRQQRRKRHRRARPATQRPPRAAAVTSHQPGHWDMPSSSRSATCSVSCTSSVFYLSVYEGWRLLEPAGTDTHSVVGGLVCDIGLKCTRSSQPFLATPSTVFYRTRRRQMNFLTATGPKLGPRRPRNVPGSTAADQQNRFYDTGKLYYESLASLPCTFSTDDYSGLMIVATHTYCPSE